MSNNIKSDITINELKSELYIINNKIYSNKKKRKIIRDDITAIIVSIPIIIILGIIFLNPVTAMPFIIKNALPLYTFLILRLIIKIKKIKKENEKLLKKEQKINRQINNITTIDFQRKKQNIKRKYSNQNYKKDYIKNRVESINLLKDYKNTLQSYGISNKNDNINREIQKYMNELKNTKNIKRYVKVTPKVKSYR